ncbi:hypothetical protein [Dyadobacter arcticus]|uniref:FERM domain-containing protein n=1 Tax=Dyadobacter arcticus TaxID=1078754 RepID=A0ABX0UIA4_9BACT|nr:hypothetical protein [Dyadobacter arcticus]NIJ52228.1 hypothetical protein [Dyadobacter arcticus]
MEAQTEPIIFNEDAMVRIELLDGSFEVNEELLNVIQRTASALELSSISGLKEVTEQHFFKIFTHLLNAHYGLSSWL